MDVFFRSNQQNYTTFFQLNSEFKPNFCSLIMSNVKNTQYNVTKKNNKLYCSIIAYSDTDPLNDTVFNDFEVEIEEGDYSAYDLSLKLEVEIPNALSDTYPLLPSLTGGLECVYNSNTMRTTINETTSNYKMTLRGDYRELFVIYDKANLGVYYENSLNYLLGFDSNVIPAISDPGEFANYTNPIYVSEKNRLLNDQYLYLCSDSIFSNNLSTYQNDYSQLVIAQVPLSSFENSSIYEPLYPKKVQLSNPGKALNNFRLFWLDSKFEPATWMNDDYHNLTLRFEE